MKPKTIMTLSLTVNAVLLSALGYMNFLTGEPVETPAFIRYISNAPPAELTLTTDFASPKASEPTSLATNP